MSNDPGQQDGVRGRPLESPANLGQVPPDLIAPDVRYLMQSQGYFIHDKGGRRGTVTASPFNGESDDYNAPDPREFRSDRPLGERISSPDRDEGAALDVRMRPFVRRLTEFGHTFSIRDRTVSGSWRPWPSSGQWRPYPGIRTEWTIDIEQGFVRSVSLEQIEYFASGDDEKGIHVGLFTRYQVVDPRLSTAHQRISLRLVRRKAWPFVGQVVGASWKGNDGNLALLAGLNGDSRTMRPLLARHDVRIVIDRGRSCWMWREKGWLPPAWDRWDGYQAVAKRLLAAPIPLSDDR